MITRKLNINARIRVTRENSVTIYGNDLSETLVIISAGQEFDAEVTERDAAFNTAFGVISLPFSEVEVLGWK